MWACWACPMRASPPDHGDLQRPPQDCRLPLHHLHPNLGVVRVGPEQSFVVADMPGLIEGASEGAGLGHQFLRHLQRTRLLLHVVDMAPFDDAWTRWRRPRPSWPNSRSTIRRCTTSRAGWCSTSWTWCPPTSARAHWSRTSSSASLEGPGVRDFGADPRRLRAAGQGHLQARHAQQVAASRRRWK
jgi:hypothetical protein